MHAMIIIPELCSLPLLELQSPRVHNPRLYWGFKNYTGIQKQFLFEKQHHSPENFKNKLSKKLLPFKILRFLKDFSISLFRTLSTVLNPRCFHWNIQNREIIQTENANISDSSTYPGPYSQAMKALPLAFKVGLQKAIPQPILVLLLHTT